MVVHIIGIDGTTLSAKSSWNIRIRLIAVEGAPGDYDAEVTILHVHRPTEIGAIRLEGTGCNDHISCLLVDVNRTAVL